MDRQDEGLIASIAPWHCFPPTGGVIGALGNGRGLSRGLEHEALRVAKAPFAALEFDGGHNPSEASAAAQSFIERTCFGR